MSELFKSKIGLGTVKFGRNIGVKYPNNFELPDKKKLRKILDFCKENNINILDTAPAYGTSEEVIGCLTENERSDWVIGTKVGEEFVNGQSYFDFTSKSVDNSLRRSFERLRTNYIDYVQIHSNGNDLMALDSGATEVLFNLKRLGKIGAVGASLKTIEGIEKAATIPLDLCMVEINIENQQFVQAAQNLIEQGISVLIKKSLLSGHLDVRKALNWLHNQNCYSAVIIGSLNCDHLRESKGILDES
jgi:aryl-alcohol dehydrogenase-like predicted oxidoreductase